MDDRCPTLPVDTLHLQYKYHRLLQFVAAHMLTVAALHRRHVILRRDSLHYRSVKAVSRVLWDVDAHR